MTQKERQGYSKHWSCKYISMPYLKYNCSKFIEFVLRDHFNIEYSFPQSEGSLFYQSHQLKKHIPEYCIKTENPKEGDLILMHGLRRMCHVGILVFIKNKPYVLHSESAMGCSCLHRLTELFNYGYSVEGYYTWLV